MRKQQDDEDEKKKEREKKEHEGALRRNRNAEFIDVMTGKTKEVGQWEDEMKADRDRRKGSTGVYNSSTGERDYGGQHRGVKKDMRGRKYR
jgi:hypothetical protein